MAGYVKMWTTIKHNRGFLSLSLHERGAFLQLVVAAKEQSDNGLIYYRNVSAMGHDLGCNWHTADKIVLKLQQIFNWVYSKNDDGTVTLKIPNYKKWQELGVAELVQKRHKSVTKIQPLRAEQSRAEQSIPYREVVEHLNLLTGKAYRHTSGNTKRFIRVRWNEGFRLDDFIYVNQIKAEEWLGTEHEKYLRPETLYGNKFEGYRQQRKISRQYSEQTNRALLEAAQYLQDKGFINEGQGLTEIDGGNAEVTGSVQQRD